jgi:hypothetical protein
MISLRASMGARSYSSRFISSDSLAPQARGGVERVEIDARLFVGVGVRSAVVPMALYMGVAAASYWLMGGRPRRSSMERSMEVVV